MAKPRFSITYILYTYCFSSFLVVLVIISHSDIRSRIVGVLKKQELLANRNGHSTAKTLISQVQTRTRASRLSDKYEPTNSAGPRISRNFHQMDIHSKHTNNDMIHSLWHVIPLHNNHVMYVIRGYLDARPSNATFGLSSLTVRMIAQSSAETHRYLLDNPPFCVFSLRDESSHTRTKRTSPNTIANKYISRAVTEHVSQRKMDPVDGIHWINTYISCPIPGGLLWEPGRELTVAFAVDPERPAPLVFLTVLEPERPKHFEAEIGMCLGTGTLHGYLGDNMADWLLEWIETNRLLGISHFHISNGTASLGPRMRKIFNYYESQGVLFLSQFPPPVRHLERFKFDSARDIADISMRVALNDCMYSNMYRYRFIAIFDLDEIIMPEKHATLTDMLHALYPRSDFGPNREPPSLVFSSRLYVPFKTQDLNNTASWNTSLTNRFYLRMQHHRAIKRISNPRNCIVTSTHLCFRPVALIQDIEDNKHAFVHHYRSSYDHKYDRKIVKEDGIIEDKRVHRYIGAITGRVESVEKTLGL